MKTVPTLHTDRCTLSAVTQNDIHVLWQILYDVETQRFLPELCKEFTTVESIQQFIFSFENYLSKSEGILWGIRKHDTLIGFVATMDLSTKPTIFFAMHPKYRNQGYMQESVRLATQYICDAKLTDELHTEVDVNNIASQKVLERCGYKVKEEQTLRFLYCYQNYNIELQTS